MPMPSADDAGSATAAAEQSATYYIYKWGENSLPPTLLATLITAQHVRPFQVFPMLFPPVLLFSTYLNLQGFKKDSAGMTSAWSAAYLVLARRRKQVFSSKFGVRGIVRGTTMALCVANVIGGGLAYAFGRRSTEETV